MALQVVAHLPSGASLYTTFFENCGRGESLRTATGVKIMVGGKQGNAPCKKFF